MTFTNMFYSQKAYKDQLGNCRDTIAQSGCFITSFCNLGKELEWFDYTPPAINKLFTRENLYGGSCLLVAPAVAKYFGLTYEKVYTDPGVLCIAETDNYKKYGVPQHFFLYEKGRRVDPLDNPPSWEPNTYHVVSYRAFKKTNQPIPIDMKPTKALAAEYKVLVGSDAGDNMNDGEQDSFAGKIKELREKVPVTIIKEVPVEVIKEVPVEVIKEVKVSESELSAVELFRLLFKKLKQ